MGPVNDASGDSWRNGSHLENVQTDCAAYDIYVWMVARRIKPDYRCCIGVVGRERDGDFEGETSVYLNAR